MSKEPTTDEFIDKETLENAINFYSGFPTGQYDEEAVVALKSYQRLQQENERLSEIIRIAELGLNSCCPFSDEAGYHQQFDDNLVCNALAKIRALATEPKETV